MRRFAFYSRRTLFLLLVFCCLVFAGSSFVCLQTGADEVLMEGIDVSRWQGDINWDQVKASGKVDFVMVGMGRVNGSATYLDPKFSYNVTQANAHGIHVGVYLYSLAKSAAAAKTEAEWVLKQIDGYKISFPVAFDMEDPSVQGLSKTLKSQIALTFLETIAAAGYYPMIYASESWFQQSMNAMDLKGYDCWVARWSNGLTFKPVNMWQYSNKGRISGISGDVDLDHCYKDYASLITPRYHAKVAVASAGWKRLNGKLYYFDADGNEQKGWFTVKKKTYYADPDSGVLQTGLVTIEGKTYYLNRYRKTGWQQIDRKYYYFNKDGVMQKGWQTIDGKRYYLDKKTGERATGWLTWRRKTYYLNKKGIKVTGWKKINRKWYYFSNSGVLQKDTTVDGYSLGSDGAAIDRQ